MNTNSINPNRSAFPREDYQGDYKLGQHGMTLREYFAAKAMQGFMAGVDSRQMANVSKVGGMRESEFVAGVAVAFADALLAELAKGGAK